jgi:hypothetical protein
MASKKPNIQLKQGTESQFVAKNTILGSGEPSFATDTKIIKIGDNSTSWTNLPNTVISNVSGITNASGVYNIVSLSSSDYNSLGTKDPKTLYLIK